MNATPSSPKASYGPPTAASSSADSPKPQPHNAQGELSRQPLRTVAAAGYWPGGPPPYGYRIEKGTDGRSDLVLNEAEAANLTRMIEALVDRRLTTWELAAVLNAENVP